MTTSYTSRLGTAPEEGVKAPCVVSTTANITLSGEQTINTVAVTAGQRVLVRSQTDNTENGIYDCSTGAWSRSTDFNDANDVIDGQIVADAHTGSLYQVSFTGDYDPGTTAMTFTAGTVAIAANTAFTPAGNIAATDVQAGMEELDTEKAALAGAVFTGPVDAGDPGFETSGIDINGTTYTHALRINDIGGTHPAEVIFHRHSTTLQPLLVTARSNSDDSTHAAVTAGQVLFSTFATGYTGSHYDIFGETRFSVGTGTVSATSSPGKWTLLLAPDGSNTPAAVITADSDKSVTFAGDISIDGSVTGSITFTGAIINGSANDVILTGTGKLACTRVAQFNASGDYSIQLAQNAVGIEFNYDYSSDADSKIYFNHGGGSNDRNILLDVSDDFSLKFGAPGSERRILTESYTIGGQGCRTVLTSNQTLTTGSAAAIEWDSDSFAGAYDSLGMHDHVSDKTKIYIPSGWSKVEVIAGVTFQANSTGDRYIQIKHNTSSRATTMVPAATLATYIQASTGVLEVVGGTDYFTVEAYQDSGGNLDIDSTATPFFTVRRVA